MLLAFPAESVTALPKLTPLVLNWTVPVGVPAPGATAVTVAVNVTDWPNTDGLTEEARDVELLALLTVWPPAMVPLMARHYARIPPWLRSTSLS